MDQSSQPERRTSTRRHQRYELETELRALILGFEPRELRGRSLDINQGGMAGVFVSGWEVGAAVQLQFAVPVATAPLLIRAVVRNCTGYRYGFEFAEVSAQQRETINKTCRTLGLFQ